MTGRRARVAVTELAAALWLLAVGHVVFALPLAGLGTVLAVAAATATLTAVQLAVLEIVLQHVRLILHRRIAASSVPAGRHATDTERHNTLG